MLLYAIPVISWLLYLSTRSWKAALACLLYLGLLALTDICPTLFVVSVTSIFIFALVQYTDIEIPEGVAERWSARILDATLRTCGKVLLCLHYFGIRGGACRPTRKLVDVVMKILTTGSPFGKGQDPELNIFDAEYAGVPVRVYEPLALTSQKRPVLVYFHGGGWTLLSVDVSDPATRELAKHVGMVVVSVGYRMSPEHPHPAPFEDCLAVTEYVLENAQKLKVDPTRMALSGDSAGGHLTAAVSLRLKKKIKIQAPIYPCLQMFDLQTPSYIENKAFIPGMLNDVSMLTYWLIHGNISFDHISFILSNQHTSPALKKSKYADYVSPRWYMKEHIRTESLRHMEKPNDSGNEELSKSLEKTIIDPYFSPLMADEEDFKDLPLTYVLTAGYDVLRDDGLMYYQRCLKAGVPVHLAHYQEGFHGMFFFFDGPLSFKVSGRAMNDLVKFLKNNL